MPPSRTQVSWAKGCSERQARFPIIAFPSRPFLWRCISITSSNGFTSDKIERKRLLAGRHRLERAVCTDIRLAAIALRSNPLLYALAVVSQALSSRAQVIHPHRPLILEISANELAPVAWIGHVCRSGTRVWFRYLDNPWSDQNCNNQHHSPLQVLYS